ncbi:MAG: pyruvate kinase [Gaiellales bacterium]
MSVVPAARRTKIVCTIGPASSDPGMIEQLAWAGMDAARLNFSHGTHDGHLEAIRGVRRAQDLIGRPLAVIADLQGPKIRIGTLQAPVTVQPGGTMTLAAPGRAAPGDMEVTFDELAETVRPGNAVLINDGLVRARVVEVQGPRVECRVEVGGIITSGKGVNLPGTPLPMPSITPKDADDLEFALEQDVDYVALSFVRRVEDVRDLKERVAAAGSSARVIAKIEKGEAIEDLEAIVTTSDVVMVARGDLGVEIGDADVPLMQKQIIAAAREAGCTVITATQMLESMVHQPEPTRAEVSDVANAVLDGTSAVMLSGETAAGRYPLEAASTMNRICRAVEPSLVYHDSGRARSGSVAMILAHAACDIAEDLNAAVIAVPTQEGSTARQVSRFRPRRPIVAASQDPRVLQQLALDWAVVPVVIESAGSLEDLWRRTVDAAAQSGLAARGDRVVVTGGRRINEPGTTDHIVVLSVE